LGLLFLTFLLYTTTIQAQNTQVSLNQTNVELGTVLSEIEKQTNYLFVHDSSVDIKKKVSVNADKMALNDVLNQLFKDTNVTYNTEGSNIILRSVASTTVEQDKKRTITGNVRDSEGKSLIGVTVVVKGTSIEAVTDVSGNFSLSVPANARALVFSYIGKKTVEMQINNRSAFNVVMEEASLQINEVVDGVPMFNVERGNIDDHFSGAGQSGLIFYQLSTLMTLRAYLCLAVHLLRHYMVVLLQME